MSITAHIFRLRSIVGGLTLAGLLLGVFVRASAEDSAKLPTTNSKTARLLEVRRIWDRAPHNAFTSLIRFGGEWICSCREGEKHAGGRGNIRVLRSNDGRNFSSSALFGDDLYDLRDPKLSQMPDGRLMMVGGAVDTRKGTGIRFRELRTFVSFSKDGSEWTVPEIVLGDWEWLWRVTWHEGIGYGVAYHVGRYGVTPRETRYGTLYQTRDGLNYQKLYRFETPDGVGETTLRFDSNGSMRLVMRRDGNRRRALLGTSRAPYKQWKFTDVDYRLGGPDFIQLADGSWLLGTRVKAGGKTTLASIDFERGRIEPKIVIDGKGDCSYPSFVWFDDKLWMSFYSSHEEKTSIYLATFSIGKQ